MKRRNFLGLPLLAVGAAAGAHDVAFDTRGAGPLHLSLLRLDGSDGTPADATLSDACWAHAGCDVEPDSTRIALNAFVPSRVRAPARVSVHALFAGEGDDPGAMHELFCHSAGTEATHKPIGFNAVRGAFAGLRVSMTDASGATRSAQIRLPLAPGQYVLLLDALAVPGFYAFSGDRARPLAAHLGNTPNYFALSIAETV
jgi:hypothetical protein